MEASTVRIPHDNPRFTCYGWSRLQHDIPESPMFGEVFDWAGDFRTIHIRKLDENSDPSGYSTAREDSDVDRFPVFFGQLRPHAAVAYRLSGRGCRAL